MAALNRTIAVLLISCLYHIGAVLGLAIGTVDSPHRQRQQQHRKNKQEGGTSSFIVGPVRCAPWFTIRGKAAATAIRSATTLATDGGLSSGESSARGGASTGFGSRANRRTKVTKKRKRGIADHSPAPPVVVLKRSSRWACVKSCGACCYLAPDERPDLAEYLPDPDELGLYKSLTLDDGWCKHFDKDNRACTIYEDRPRFCRVETETFGEMYGVEPEDMDDFCSSCCTEQIGDVYGSKSKEMKVFKSALAALARGERPTPISSPFNSRDAGARDQQQGGTVEDPRIRDWGLKSLE